MHDLLHIGLIPEPIKEFFFEITYHSTLNFILQ